MKRNSKVKILFLDAPTVDLGDVDLAGLRRLGRYQALKLRVRDPLPKSARTAEILITNKFVLNEAILQGLPRLKLIAIAATGTNNVDLAAAQRRGIAVANVAGYSTQTVVEHAVLFILALGHRLLEHDQSVKEGAWSRAPYFTDLTHPFSDVAGKTLGIVGYGTIGQKVAQAASALGMKICVAALPGRVYSKKTKRFSLQQVLRRSDFVSLHCILSPATERLINAKTLAWMKPSAYLLNLARGPVMDERAVALALRQKKLAGFAADVLSQEPPPANHPFFNPKLADRILLTPHIAWASCESRQSLVDEIAKNIAAFLRGKRRNRVV